MNFNSYIQFFLLSLLMLLPKTVFSQNLPSVCANGRVRYGVSDLPGSTFVWDVQGGTIIRNYNDSVDVLWDSNAGIHTISYREVSQYGCSSPVGTGYVMVIKPFLDLGTDLVFCQGQSANLDAGNGFSQYIWSNGSSSRNLVASTPGIYWVDATDSNGCTVRDSVLVTVNALPVVNLGNDTMICAPKTVEIDAGNFGSFFEWSNGSTAQSIIASEGDGTIWVRVTDNIGCVGTDTIKIIQCYAGEKLQIPNAFTPNDDGDHDIWRIGKSQDYPRMTIKVYDRWGRMVYASEPGYAKPWDGSSKGKPLPMDTYYYIVDFGDGSSTQVGSVAIIR
ncbi:MAG TPA: gliding motility-associated C-terminal domain-containing protein [Bacteroidales bacterium]|nr:gliding motility-associated C-terminal domain-containing protein [Bacteroidales bacterium]